MKSVLIGRAYAAHRTRLGVAVVVATSLLSFGRAEFHETPFAPIHDLANMPSIRLDVDGMPNPIGRPAVSEATIRRVLVKQLEDSGVIVRASVDADIPTLRVRVLAPHIAAQYFYTVTVELEERCHIVRKPDADIPFCKTWSIYPRLGFFLTGEEWVLTNAASDAVTQFTRAWGFDNKRPDV